MALRIIPGDPDSAAKTFAHLKTKLVKEKTARKVAQIEVDMLAQAVNDLKISADKFVAQIPTLEDKVKHLENNMVEMKSGPGNSTWSAPLGRMMTTRSITLN
jgi:nicotinamide mononucleotide adenylyltransferase